LRAINQRKLPHLADIGKMSHSKKMLKFRNAETLKAEARLSWGEILKRGKGESGGSPSCKRKSRSFGAEQHMRGAGAQSMNAEGRMEKWGWGRGGIFDHGWDGMGTG
jgi:hypothetical protein